MARGSKKNRGPALRRGRDESTRGDARRNRLREIAGVGCIVLTIAAIIALASFNARDPSLNTAGGSRSVHNYLGVFGAYFADILVQLFGFGAWIFPLFAFGAAVLLFAGIAVSLLSRLGRSLGLLGFSLSIVALGNLAFGAVDPVYGGGGTSVPGGGALGNLLVRFCRPLLGDTGTALIFTFLLIASFTLATHLTPRRIAQAAWAGVKAAWEGLKRAWELRRGRKAKELARHKRGAGTASERPPQPERVAEPPLEIDEEDLAVPMIVQRPPPLRKKPVAARRSEPTRSAGTFVLPPLDLLDDPPGDRAPISRDEILANSRILERKLADFGVNGKVTQVHPGPVITMYEYELAPGIKMNRI